jgi:FK506-binding protein 4/5
MRKNWEKVIKYTTKVIEFERKNLKALQKRSNAYYHNNDLLEAKDDLNTILEIDNNNSDAKKLFLIVEKKLKEKDQKESSIFKNIFSN